MDESADLTVVNVPNRVWNRLKDRPPVQISFLPPWPIMRLLVVGGIVIASAVYVWQVAIGLANQDKVDQHSSGLSIKSLVVVRNSDALVLRGTGIATGASGTLSFDRHGGLGLLQVLDMPVLPAEKIYEMWVTDEDGQVHASSLFRVPVEGQEDTTIVVSVARILGTSTRYFGSLEPAGGSLVPTGQVVMDR